MDDGFDPLEGLTGRQRLACRQLLSQVKAPSWSWQLPVLLHQRCWLRLSHPPGRPASMVLLPTSMRSS